MTKTITGTLNAYITPYSGVSADGEITLESLAFSTSEMKSSGWTKVGTAEIIVTLLDTDAMVGERVQSLNAMAEEVQRQADEKIARIKNEIRNLTALTFTPSTAEA